MKKAECPRVLDVAEAIKKIRGASVGMMYGKIGTTELQALEYSDRRIRSNWVPGATWRRQSRRLFIDSGVFPDERDEFEFFLKTYKQSVQQIDAICIWQEEESYLRAYEENLWKLLCPKARLILPEVFSPFTVYEHLWGIKLLIVSPFVRTMQRQVGKLKYVFEQYNFASIVGDMKERCEFVRCPFFSYLEESPYSSWRDGLEKMTEEILSHRFDLAMIGAGAWSLPLLANIKRHGRKGLHTGGSTQLFFGIRGRRWNFYDGCNVFNQHWTYPLPEDTPKGHMRKENGCYW